AILPCIIRLLCRWKRICHSWMRENSEKYAPRLMILFSTEMRSAAAASESTRTTYRKKCLRHLDLRKNRHTASSAFCLKHLSMEYRLTQDLHTVWTVLLCLWQSRTASVT